MSLPVVHDLTYILQQTLGVLRYQASLGLQGLSLAEGALRLSAQPLANQNLSPPQAALAGRVQRGVLGLKSRMPLAVPPRAADALAPSDIAEIQVRPELDAVRESLVGCSRCKLSRTRTSIVFGTGDAKARLMFVGAAPGRDEDLQGEPFVGEAGRLLDRMIAAMGLSRQTVYIANIVKCRPPRSRDPDADEVLSCASILRRQVAAVQPDVIVALGRFAALTLLDEQTATHPVRGCWGKYGQTPVMPTFHPAHLLHNPGDKKLVWQDLQHVMARLGLVVKNNSAAS